MLRSTHIGRYVPGSYTAKLILGYDALFQDFDQILKTFSWVGYSYTSGQSKKTLHKRNLRL